jgi:hypothetical protein
MNFGQTRLRLVQAGAALAAAALVAGCANSYHPTVTPITSTGPAPQPQSFALVISAPSSNTPGVASVIDYSGDSLMNEQPIGPGPTAVAVDSLGANAYTLNSDGTLTSFPFNTTFIQNKEISITLASTAEPVSLFASSNGLWAADLCTSDPTAVPCTWDDAPLTNNFSGADVFIGSPQAFLRSIPVAPTPIMIAGPSSSAQRFFAVSQGNQAKPAGGNVSSAVACNTSPSTVGVNGEADGIEVGSYSISSQIALDPTSATSGTTNAQCPVYAIENAGGSRLFVLNRGSDTVSVINTQFGTLDSCTPFIDPETGRTVTCHPILPLSTTALSATGVTPSNCNLTADPTCGGMTATAGPVYAEYVGAKNLLVVANYDGGTISIIDVSLDEFGNDSATFGTTYTVKVGQTSTPHPASVTVLFDGSRAYTANQTDGTDGGTVSIVTLSSHTLETPIPLAVTGHPRTVVSTQNSSYGKVYVASPDSNVLTIIRTDEDIVDTTLLMEGDVVDVRVSSQNAVSGNSNNVTRTPGYGQPCNLPDVPGGYQVVGAPAGTTAEPSSSLANCGVHDPSGLQVP